MKWPYPFILIAGMLFSSIADAQINGKVVGASHEPILFCPVVIENAKDSSRVASATTNSEGHFTIDQHLTGTFRVRLSYLGYLPYLSAPFTVTDKDLGYTLPDLVLTINNIQLHDVNIISEKPYIEHKADRTVYNISNNDLLIGKNGAEILQTLPGVIAPDDGTISLAGKNNTMIMIDGRPIYLSGQDANDYLKSIDASQIDKIEIITNPSAKYDAGGGAIINIILKKNTKLGFNGNLSLTDRQGYYNSGNGSINAGYRTKKWNIYGNGGINTSHNYSTSDITRNFLANVPEQTFQEQSMNTSYGYSPTLRLGVDYMPDENTTFGIVASGHYSPSWSNNNYSTTMFSVNPSPDSSNDAIGSGYYSSRDLSLSTRYTFKIDSTGKEFSANIDYSNYTSSSTSQKTIDYFDEYYAFLRAPSGFDLDVPHTTSTETGQVDYTLPVNKKIKIDAGIKAVLENTDNNAQYWNLIQGAEIPDTTRSNHFNFTQNIYSAYTRYAQELSKKISFSLGLRFENTQDKGIQYVHDTSFTRNYYNLFPGGNISWSIDSNSTLTGSYSQSINRPSYNQLNPFLQYSTPYSYTTGNINLQPQLSYSYEVSYSFESLISSSLEYTHSGNLIEWLWEPNSTTHISYNTPINLSSSDSYYLFLTFYKTVSKFWTAMTYMSLQQTYYSGTVEGSNYGNGAISYYVYAYSGFTFKHGWKSDISLNYHSPTLYGFSTNLSWYNLNVSVSKKIAKDRGLIRLACSNILVPNSYSSTQSILNTNVHSQSFSYPRVVSATLSWKLGKMKH